MKDHASQLTINTQVNEADIRKRLGRLAYKSGAVMARASNRAVRHGKTVIARETSSRYRIKQSTINDKKYCKPNWAKASAPTASLIYTGHNRNLSTWQSGVSPFKVIEWDNDEPNVKVYSASVMRKSGFHKLTEEPKSFLQMTRNGFVGMFRRKSEKRNAKLEGVGGPAVPQIVKNKEIMDKFNTESSTEIQKRLKLEIDRVLRGSG